MNNEEKILEMLTQMRGDITEMRGDIAEIKERVTKVETTQENIVLPRIQLLAEGHTAIQEQIKRLSVIDRMEDDISTLKAAVKYLSGELEQLKKAM